MSGEIAFTRTSSFVFGGSDIYVMNPDGSGQTDLTRDSLSHWNGPAWSPDGKEIALFGRSYSPKRSRTSIRTINADGQIYIMGADGSGKREVSRRVRASSGRILRGIKPIVSPAGQRPGRSPSTATGARALPVIILF